MSSQLLKNSLKYLITALILYIVLFGIYVFSSNGLTDTPFYLQLRRFLPMALITSFSIQLLKEKLPTSYFLSFIPVALAWIFTYPLLYKATYQATNPFFSHHFDIVFACYSACGLMALTYLLQKFVPAKLVAFTLSTLQFLLLLVPISQVIYYLTYKSCISESGMLALLQTTPAEAKEYMVMLLGYPGVIALAVFYALIWFTLFKLNSTGLQNAASVSFSKPILVFLTLVGIATPIYSFATALPQTGVIQLARDVRAYFKSAEKFHTNHKELFQKLVVTPPTKSFAKPSTIIMVIGESASRKYMSAYYEVQNDTTPWMRKQKDSPNFVLYTNAYSSWFQTVPALERALTNKSQYNEIEFNQSITLLDIAKKAGYKTYWISNQTTVDVADTPITLVGETADIAKWTNQDSLALRYDGTLLQYLKEVDPNTNNFVVLHLMGSHEDTKNRYPTEFNKFNDNNRLENLNTYDNSLLYTDYILEQIHQYAQQNLNLQAMLYFSDHGILPGRTRHPDKNHFYTLRIPMLLYLAPEYQQLYPETTQALKAHRDKYFTNDLTFELICGLLNVKAPVYDETKGLASNKYSFTRETLKTNLGKDSLTEDKEP